MVLGVRSLGPYVRVGVGGHHTVFDPALGISPGEEHHFVLHHVHPSLNIRDARVRESKSNQIMQQQYHNIVSVERVRVVGL